jgi:hypothetical protein
VDRDEVTGRDDYLCSHNSLVIVPSCRLFSNPSTRGKLFNLPQVIEGARNVLEPEVASRIEFVPGNFFRTVPSGGDLLSRCT